MTHEPVFNVAGHLLVPKHVLLDEKEKQRIMETYAARPEDFPKILITDLGIQHLGPKDGDIIKILRSSPTAGEAYFYRVVVSE